MQTKYLFKLLSKYRTALMGIAAIWILIFHEWNRIFDAIPVLGEMEHFIKRIGFCGVDIFLLLSGMGLTFSIKKSKNIGVFYVKRLKRIVLPFVFMGVIKLIFSEWTFVDFLKILQDLNFFPKPSMAFYGLFLQFAVCILCSLYIGNYLRMQLIR